MSTRTNVVFPTIREANRHSYEVYDQDFNALTVDDPKTKTVTINDRRVTQHPYEERRSPNVPVYVTETDPRINQLENKVSMAINQQNKVLAQQEQVTNALHQQQQLTQGLIHKAFQNKDEFIENLSQQNDSLAVATRRLLQDHIKYITAIVQGLNHDISLIEEHIRHRDSAVIGTNSAVNKLEVHHVTMLQDLRSRIVRCDTALTKHTVDIKTCNGEIQQLARNQLVQKDELIEKLHRLEAEMLTMTGELERLHGDQYKEITHMKKDTNKELSLLDERNNTAVTGVRNALALYKSNVDVEMEQIEKRLLATVEKTQHNWNTFVDQLDGKVDDRVQLMEARLRRLEEGLNADRLAIRQIQNVIESRLLQTIDKHTRYNQDEIVRAKNEFRKGFTEVHESISNAKRVLEGRNKLLEENLKKEIRQLRKLIVFE